MTAATVWAVGWIGGDDERHVTALLEQAVADAGLSTDPLEPHNYFVDRFNGACAQLDQKDRWAGNRAVTRASHPADHVAAADSFAAVYETAGWEVVQWQRPSTGGLAEARFVRARRDVDRISGTFDEGLWTISVTSGPCVAFFPDIETIANWELIDD